MDIERPVTRWRRDGRPPSTRSSNEDLVERPKSRRGAFYSGSPTEKARSTVRPPSAVRAYPSYSSTPSGRPSGMMTAEKIPINIQQGLNVMRTATSRGQRTRLIQDKRYFQGALQLKIGQLSTELSNIQKDMEKSTRDQASIAVYDRKVKQMATELTDLQGALADHNMALDKINVGSDTHKILLEAREQAATNDADVVSLETLFADRMRRQEAIKDLEDQIEKEKFKAEQLESEMNSSQRDQFNSLKKQKNEILVKAEKLQSEINSLNKTKTNIADQVFISPAKSELVQLELKLWELENKKEHLVHEMKTSLSPEEQRRELLNKVKQDNAQTTTMRKAISDMKDQIREAELSLSQTTQNIDDGKSSTRYAKFIELKDKEKAIEDFLATVESLKLDESNKLKNLGNEIVPLLKKIAEKIAVVPTAADYKSLQINNTVSSEMLNTVKSIGTEHSNVTRYLNKVEVMVKNIGSELKSLNNKINTMKSDIEVYSNILELENEIDIKRISLTKEKAKLEIERPKTKTKKKETVEEFNEIQKKLVENEGHAQISYIEKKLATTEQSNYSIKDYLEDIKSEEDVEIYRSKALDIVQQLNKYNRGKLVS
ncbi:intraflagellar transport protein 74 homolog isoform X2 [Cimex lectularius]|uniref:Uncharacterized protein n=1 Tax=Cimex lectularius TaxID=79782 RepID=A0A8I6RQZ1_CIMLE|nr:intraflagellar transport protein 74 homolog isoform X2 [Cimex lectularius]